MDKGQVIARVALLGADDAGGDGVLQPKGRANGHDPFTHFQAIDIADLHGGQALGIDFDHGHVGAFVGPDDFGLEFALVGQGDHDLAGTLDHVGVGHDVAIAAQDKARADAAGLALAVIAALIALGAGALLGRHAGHGQAKAAEEFEHVRVHARKALELHPLAGDFFHGADIHHRGADGIDQGAEIGQALHQQRIGRRGLGLGGRQRRREMFPTCYASGSTQKSNGQQGGVQGFESGHGGYPFFGHFFISKRLDQKLLGAGLFPSGRNSSA